MQCCELCSVPAVVFTLKALQKLSLRNNFATKNLAALNGNSALTSLEL